jgi:dolichol kinase
MTTPIIIKELLRKSIHLLSLVIVLIYVYLGKQTLLNLLILYLALLLLIEHFRLTKGIKIPLFDFLFRDKERAFMGGHVFFALGSLIAIGVYSKEVAITSILFITFGDLAASLVGITLGKTRVKGTNKSLEGSAAEFLIDIVIGIIVLKNLPVAFLMALVATLTETYLSGIDDNLSIPVFAGLSAELMLLILAL